MSEKPVLVLGNRVYSSWSMRGWLLMAQSGLEFEEEMHWLDRDEYRDGLLAATGGIGTVPALRIGRRVISDSLAIAEYAAEAAPEAGLWPNDPLDRAEARSLCARMHSGFAALRQQCPMNLSNRFEDFIPNAAVRTDLAMLDAMWAPVLDRSGGPFLFGAFGAVDAFFAPVALRIYSFRLPVAAASNAYSDALRAHPLVRRWIDDARPEGDPARIRNDRFMNGGFTPGDWPILSEGGGSA